MRLRIGAALLLAVSLAALIVALVQQRSDPVDVATAQEPLDLLWYEDPIPPRPIEPLGHLQAAIAVPVSTGENLYAIEDFWDLLTVGRVRVGCD